MFNYVLSLLGVGIFLPLSNRTELTEIVDFFGFRWSIRFFVTRFGFRYQVRFPTLRNRICRITEHIISQVPTPLNVLSSQPKPTTQLANSQPTQLAPNLNPLPQHTHSPGSYFTTSHPIPVRLLIQVATHQAAPVPASVGRSRRWVARG